MLHSQLGPADACGIIEDYGISANPSFAASRLGACSKGAMSTECLSFPLQQSPALLPVVVKQEPLVESSRPARYMFRRRASVAALHGVAEKKSRKGFGTRKHSSIRAREKMVTLIQQVEVSVGRVKSCS